MGIKLVSRKKWEMAGEKNFGKLLTVQTGKQTRAHLLMNNLAMGKNTKKFINKSTGKFMLFVVVN